MESSKNVESNLRKVEASGNFHAVADALEMIAIADESGGNSSEIDAIAYRWKYLPMGELIDLLRESLRDEQ